MTTKTMEQVMIDNSTIKPTLETISMITKEIKSLTIKTTTILQIIETIFPLTIKIIIPKTTEMTIVIKMTILHTPTITLMNYLQEMLTKPELNNPNHIMINSILNNNQ